LIRTIKFAKRLAKRLDRAHSLTPVFRAKLSFCQEVVARSYGWTNYHHLRRTVGTPGAPQNANARGVADFVAETWPSMASFGERIAHELSQLEPKEGHEDSEA
jgi:hypothetical protein